MRKLLKSVKALSPVVAAIILIAVVVSVAVAASSWMGALTFSFMKTEELKVVGHAWASDNSYIDLTVKNYGTSVVTISEVKVNGVTASSVAYLSGDATLSAGGSATLRVIHSFTSGAKCEFTIITATAIKHAYVAVAPYVASQLDWFDDGSDGHELGIWHEPNWAVTRPEASWVVAYEPTYIKKRENISVILNWVSLHEAWDPFNPFETESEIKEVEEGLKSVPTQNFWGIMFISEEHYRVHIWNDRLNTGFPDNLDTTWFGERLLGYQRFIELERPNATRDQWADEMFLRMIRGFYDYFHAEIKVGITANKNPVTIERKRKFGEPAFAFIREHYDFVILYAYTENLQDFQQTKEYFSLIDELFTKQKKLWILTRIFPKHNEETWELEATALEIKNCLDRNIVITCYYWNEPPFDETWASIKKAIKLYESKAPYFESYVYGKNMLTDYLGNTYGWVEVL